MARKPTRYPRRRAALDYAQKGWHVFPVYEIDQAGRCCCRRPGCSSPGKHPRALHGFKDATVDRAQILRWWADAPHANVGIRTGAESGLFVIDIDPKNGGEGSMAKLIEEYGALPDSRIAKSLCEKSP